MAIRIKPRLPLRRHELVQRPHAEAAYLVNHARRIPCSSGAVSEPKSRRSQELCAQSASPHLAVRARPHSRGKTRCTGNPPDGAPCTLARAASGSRPCAQARSGSLQNPASDIAVRSRRADTDGNSAPHRRALGGGAAGSDLPGYLVARPAGSSQLFFNLLSVHVRPRWIIAYY